MNQPSQAPEDGIVLPLPFEHQPLNTPVLERSQIEHAPINTHIAGNALIGRADLRTARSARHTLPCNIPNELRITTALGKNWSSATWRGPVRGDTAVNCRGWGWGRRVGMRWYERLYPSPDPSFAWPAGFAPLP